MSTDNKSVVMQFPWWGHALYVVGIHCVYRQQSVVDEQVSDNQCQIYLDTKFFLNILIFHSYSKTNEKSAQRDANTASWL